MTATPDRSNRKNTKRKYADDHTGEDSPHYMNIGELMSTLGLSTSQLIEMQASVEQLFDEHPENIVTGIKGGANQTKIDPLLEFLSNKYRLLFDPENPEYFIRSSLYKLIGRVLSNKRRRDVRKSSRNSSETPFDPPPGFQSMASIGPEENFVLRASLEGSDLQESRCTVGNILDKAADDQVGLNVIQRISYQKWLTILRENLETDLDLIIRYESREGRYV